METLLVTIPGSRRPITISAPSFIDPIEPASTSTSTLPSTAPSISSPSIATLRRKPRFTYKSPSSHDTGFCVENPSKSAPPSASTSRLVNETQLTANINPTRLFSPRPMYISQPSRSIYHPKGRLATFLPRIDPETLGLGSIPITIDDPTRRSSSRARRPAAKLRDLNADPTEAGSTVFGPASNAETLPREKASPRKRRAGGQGGKRKRREVDDADATYPAKRTRNARGAAGPPPSDIGSQAGSVPPGTTADASEAGDALEEKVLPERRSTRARAAATKSVRVRRNSSASEGTQTSVSISIAAIRARKEKDTDAGADADVGVNGSEAAGAEVAEGVVNADAKEPAAEKIEETEEAPGDVLAEQEPMDVVPLENGGAVERSESAGQGSAGKPETEAEAEAAAPAVEVPAKVEPEPENQKEEGELSEDGELPA
ncbi:hypothetical protein EVG20_g866 [Dentipellis fragilis]|uniref:Uncharacterized protein n=1 Tax=Dentipellis fragilis TaxID=205917 RepID=A0A4Y9ZE87_9AGAM|nr:hypothetical protein EVG20_g866 [Dentipellis fragilis]